MEPLKTFKEEEPVEEKLLKKLNAEFVKLPKNDLKEMNFIYPKIVEWKAKEIRLCKLSITQGMAKTPLFSKTLAIYSFQI